MDRIETPAVTAPATTATLKGADTLTASIGDEQEVTLTIYPEEVADTALIERLTKEPLAVVLAQTLEALPAFSKVKNIEKLMQGDATMADALAPALEKAQRDYTLTSSETRRKLTRAVAELLQQHQLDTVPTAEWVLNFLAQHGPQTLSQIVYARNLAKGYIDPKTGELRKAVDKEKTEAAQQKNSSAAPILRKLDTYGTVSQTLAMLKAKEEGGITYDKESGKYAIKTSTPTSTAAKAA